MLSIQSRYGSSRLGLSVFISWVILLLVNTEVRYVKSQVYSDSEMCVVPVENSTVSSSTIGATEVSPVFEGSETSCIRDYSQCNVNDTVTLSTDVYTYVGAVTTVTISVNTSEIEESVLYYKICTGLGDTEMYTLLSCVKQNSSVFESMVDWKLIGYNVLSVEVYRDDRYSSRVDCQYSQVVVANNSGVDLTVELYNSPDDLPTLTVPDMKELAMSSNRYSKTKPPYLIGNITFVSKIKFSNLSEAESRFTYDFGDNSEIIHLSNESNITHYYNSTGSYNYSVHVFVVLEDVQTAFHTSRESEMDVYQRVTDPLIVVGRTNSVQLGVSKVTVSVSGSFPIALSWCLLYVNTTSCSRLPLINSSMKRLPHNISHTVLNNNDTSLVTFTVLMNFTSFGMYQFRANFTNIASDSNSTFNFSVNPAPSPIVVVITISSATIGILVSLLVIIVISILVIVTVIIPYRRYKARMTETANFNFVDLSESGKTLTGRVSKSANKFVSYFQPQKNARVGLVNTDYGTVGQPITKYSPHESL